MYSKLFVVVSLAVMQGCTSVIVDPIDESYGVHHVCIEENQKIVFDGFIKGIESIIHGFGITPVLYARGVPSTCEYVVKYTATRSWDLRPYLSHAEVRVFKNEKIIGYAVYHLTGEGGFSPAKYDSVEQKMKPVLIRLFGRSN